MTRTLTWPIVVLVLLSASEATAQRDISDDYSATARRVRQALHGLTDYGVFDDLAFRVDGSTITLSGSVLKVKLKRDAELAVKKIDGVGQIFNDIEVLPESTNDDALRSIVYRAIYKDPVLGPRYANRALSTIHIVVDDGEVRLEGVVDTQADKDLAGTRADVRQADKVTNHLQLAK